MNILPRVLGNTIMKTGETDKTENQSSLFSASITPTLPSAAKYTCWPTLFFILYLFEVSQPVNTETQNKYHDK